jgi:hypothetical protein
MDEEVQKIDKRIEELTEILKEEENAGHGRAMADTSWEIWMLLQERDKLTNPFKNFSKNIKTSFKQKMKDLYNKIWI